MQAYNDISSAIFDVLMAPFGHGFAGFDLVFWPIVMGIGALQVYKYVSNQSAIARVKRQISMHLLEIRLFKHDIVQVLKSTGTILAKNMLYLGHNLLPLAVMIAPMVALMVQLVAHYAYAPSPPGSVELLRLPGVKLDAPAVRTADGQVFWRLRAEEVGDHVLKIKLDGETFEKGWAVGGDPRKIPLKRLRSWEALLYPGEAAIPSVSPVLSLELDMHIRPLRYFPEGEFGILMWSLILSLVAGFALKSFFGVTI
jgi:hypothetical protein